IQDMAEKTLEASESSVPTPEDAPTDAGEAHTEDTDTEGDTGADEPVSVVERVVESTENDGHQPTEAQSFDGTDGDENAETAAQSDAKDAATRPVLTDVQEVGSDRADVLREAGFESVEDVATAGQNTLTEIDGIGGARAETIRDSATDLLDEDAGGEQEVES